MELRIRRDYLYVRHSLLAGRRGTIEKVVAAIVLPGILVDCRWRSVTK
jgi:hypothetical protein